MSRDVLNASSRTLVGSNAVKKLRNDHQIPGVLYGHHIESQPIQISNADFDKFYKRHGVGASLDLNVDGKTVFALLKDVTVDLFKHNALHVEFQALSAGEKIKLKIPLNFTGKEAIPAGYLFQEMHHEIEVHVLPKDLIESIEINVTETELGAHLTIGDLDIAKNDAFEIMEHLDTIIYSISEAKIQMESEETEDIPAATEVPVIGEE